MGKLLYMRMVRGFDDELYKKYQILYDSLPGRIDKPKTLPEKISEPTSHNQAEMLVRIMEFYQKGDIAQATQLMNDYEARWGTDDRGGPQNEIGKGDS